MASHIQLNSIAISRVKRKRDEDDGRLAIRTVLITSRNNLHILPQVHISLPEFAPGAKFWTLEALMGIEKSQHRCNIHLLVEYFNNNQNLIKLS